ncbi:MAG: hypothetical protein WBX25_27750 [Rhodomicrobium sp.]
MPFRYEGPASGEGHGHLTIYREGRVTELPLMGSHHHLDEDTVRDVCEKLELNVLELPKNRPQAR